MRANKYLLLKLVDIESTELRKTHWLKNRFFPRDPKIFIHRDCMDGYTDGYRVTIADW